MLWLYVALGGAAGSVARYLVGPAVQGWSGGTFPAGTLAINVAGSFLIGLILQYATDGTPLSPETRILLTTGFCGGFTTFSTFSWETVRLLTGGEWLRGLVYAAASVVLSLGATLLGMAAAHQFLLWRRGA